MGQFQLDNGAAGGAFGIAVSSVNGELRFAAVDDNTNNLDVRTFKEQSSSGTVMDLRDVDEVFRLLGSGSTDAPRSPEGRADAQLIQADLDVSQLDRAMLISDITSGAGKSTITEDTQTLKMDFDALVPAEHQVAQDSRHDQGMAAMPTPGAGHAAATQDIDWLFAADWSIDM